MFDLYDIIIKIFFYIENYYNFMLINRLCYNVTISSSKFKTYKYYERINMLFDRNDVEQIKNIYLTEKNPSSLLFYCYKRNFELFKDLVRLKHIKSNGFVTLKLIHHNEFELLKHVIQNKKYNRETIYIYLEHAFIYTYNKPNDRLDIIKYFLSMLNMKYTEELGIKLIDEFKMRHPKRKYQYHLYKIKND